FVGQWSDSNITTLVHGLECFHKLSGLRINMCKSKLMGLHVDGELVHRAARQLGCLVLNLPFSYLGSIVGDNMARQQAWGGIVDRVKKKLKFFNGHVQDSKKASWLNWNNVLMSKDRGGLRVSSLYAINRGLLVKWVWRFVSQRDSLWARSIKAIHGSLFQSGFQVKKGHNSCWRSIIKEVESLSKKGIHVLNYLRIKLGDGKSSKFWCDSWSDEGVLKDMFPRVYALESCKNITIADKVRQENPYQTFRRTPRGGVEQEQFQHVDRFLARWWKVSIENFDCYDEWLEWIDSIRMSKKTKIMMEAVFYTSWWMI
nr:RNA-directed DNA polymerase, eukaryota, reverse transcriptase zinc-binding domain protein [Tanacetum cinerariifolium]